ncbi:MAG: CopG family transcriptional regulator [Lentisphaerae bacterium]|jgi:putative iron-only hydrogenase system regulator|nr:CopG family transcriptional regulator [Lentisphaerota bacterium]MBT4819427.1 CopG family transcriptional regulator [Lentisphaerota bacterium]MBT5605190.1 CopG family transcriptional regulator [Lentisphaerota bacterium]MBT7054358.1 CopG family transcriptional regulator [Lentisphaerota bacterium]MBT7844858.1 CopG family transcriptional regulator [Lentisphaerota bacterium]
MEQRVGAIAILVRDRKQATPKVNALLSDFGDIIIGRIGVPYREKGVNVMAVLVDGTTDQLGALTGKLGSLEGVTTKSLLLMK